MNFKPIIIVAGEPNSVFLELYFKTLKKNKFTSPLILIASKKILQQHMKKLNFKKKLNLINYKNIQNYELDNKSINLINVENKKITSFKKISKNSNEYIKNSFEIGFKLLKMGYTNKFINALYQKKLFK